VGYSLKHKPLRSSHTTSIPCTPHCHQTFAASTAPRSSIVLGRGTIVHHACVHHFDTHLSSDSVHGMTPPIQTVSERRISDGQFGGGAGHTLVTLHSTCSLPYKRRSGSPNLSTTEPSSKLLLTSSSPLLAPHTHHVLRHHRGVRAAWPHAAGGRE
jgi:hypothetical protein